MSSDWRRFISQSVTDPRDLPRRLAKDGAGDEMKRVSDIFPMRINPYFLSLIRGLEDPLAIQAIPNLKELDNSLSEQDPLCEESQSPVSGLIHRYPDRVAFIVSDRCAVHCRFCMRKRKIIHKNQITPSSIAAGLDYIRKHPSINEVILTGGDPLMLTDSRLDGLLKDLRAIAHVRLLRLHTRMPNVLPQRITQALADILADVQPMYVNVHFNHPREITDESAAACARLVNAGILLGSQTVLLKGVNDDPDILKELMLKLLEIRVKPYYLHQLDAVAGSAHFQVPPSRSLSLITALRGHVSGMAVPHLMIDLPGGGGKVALAPNAVVEKNDSRWTFRNRQGKIFHYPVF